MMRAELRERVRVVARAPVLLLACDYDGTLAPLVDEPGMALPDPGALAAFRAAAAAPWVCGAVVSGRAIETLRGFLGTCGETMLVGSHGAEWLTPGVALSSEQAATLEALAGCVGEIVSGDAEGGLMREIKPASVVLHVRKARREVASRAIAQAVERCAGLPGVGVRYGSAVVEFMVIGASKAAGVARAKSAAGAGAVIFIGDDLTDEDVFKSLSAHDVGIKVGHGETAAAFRVDGIDGVAQVLRELREQRVAWAQTRAMVPLDRCGILSDQRTAAVVTDQGRVCWLCVPRLDSGALFASLLGGDQDGYFDVKPAGGGPAIESGYDGDTMVMVTRWAGLRVTDYLDCSGGRAYQKAGRADLIRVIEGTQRAVVRFAPRLDYGRVSTQLRACDGGLIVEGSNDPIVLRSEGVRWTIVSEGVHQTAEAVVDPAHGPVVLELRYGTGSLKAGVESEGDRREQNTRFWSGWARSLRLPSRYPDRVLRSALVLKALCYGPSGAMAAAVTTSLPEQVGGVRNWDYRYCWPRDASLAAASLVRLGNTGHAMKLLDWLLGVLDECESPDRLRPIYSLSGGGLPPEAEIGGLQGFAQSTPVRVGNAAANQVQLDVFGPIVRLVAMLAQRGAPIAPDHWRLVRAMVRAVESRWTEPDHGIWEMRLERRHHVHSKVMCWHTVDRALVVEEAVCGTQNPEWVALREAIRSDVLAYGWSERAGAFVGAYGHDFADAAVLAVGLTGMLQPTDPRWAGTVEFIRRELFTGSCVYRYKAEDGLPGREGGMHICTGWLIEALISLGRLDEAHEMLDRFASMMTNPGILTEQFDPRHNLAIGNLAQAYSHLAFIDAAVAIDNT